MTSKLTLENTYWSLPQIADFKKMSLFHHIYCSASLAAVTVFLGSQGLIIGDMVSRRELAGLLGGETTSGSPVRHRLCRRRWKGPLRVLSRPVHEATSCRDDPPPCSLLHSPGKYRAYGSPKETLKAWWGSFSHRNWHLRGSCWWPRSPSRRFIIEEADVH